MNLDRRLRQLVQDSWLWVFLTIALGLCGGVLTVWQASALAGIIDRVFLEKQSLGMVAYLVELLLGIILLRSILNWGGEFAANRLAIHVKMTLRARLFEHLQALGPYLLRDINNQKEDRQAPIRQPDSSEEITVSAKLQDSQSQTRTGELVNLASEGIEALEAYVSQYLPQLALAALVPLTILVFVFPLDATSSLVLLLTAPLIPVFMILIGHGAEALAQRQWRTLGRMSAHFLDVLQGLATLKILGRSQEQIRVIARVSQNHRQATLRVLRVAFLSALALEIVATLSTAVVAVEVGLRLLYGRLAFEPALAILLLAPEFYLPLRLLGTRFHAGTTGATAASRIFEVLDIPAHPGRVRDGHDDIPPGASFHWSTIAFEGVCFSYPGEPEVLKSATFHLSAGERLALTGPSGAGKSTIASLLLRFIEAQAGQITVDGRNITEIPRETWLSQVSWVPQAPYLFHDSIAANIWMARPSASPEDVISAIRLAGAEEFIRQLPQGLETVVGERGLRLSGGQAQRIALARAFLKDAPLLILDEATTHLDPDLEMQIHLATTRLMVGRTVLIITHRPPTFANLDRILYLQEGRIQESSPSAIDDLPEQAYLSTEPDLPGQFTPRPDSSVSRPTGGSEEIPTTPGTEAGASLPRQGSILWRLLRFISPYKKWVALSAMLGSATIGSAIGLMVTSAFIISAAALHPSIAVLETAIVGVRFFGISRGIFRYLERLVTHDITLRLLAQLRVWFYRSLEPLAPARLLLQRSGDLLSRAISDINTLENFYVRAVSPPLVAIIVAISASAILASYASVLGAMLLVMILAAGVGLPILLYLLTRKPGRQVITQRAALNHVLVDGLQGMADLQVFGQEGHQLEKVIALGDSLAQSQMRLGSVASLQTAANLLLANLAAWLTLVLAIPFVVEGRIAGVYLAGLVLISLTSFEAVALLPQAAQQLESCLQAAHRLFELVDARPEVQEPENPLPVPREFHLALHNLEFRYPHPLREAFNPLIIEGVTFELAAGQQVAIVGPSGAGKSTIVNLLLRFWEYGELNDHQDNAGVVHHDGQSSILLNGKALRSYSPNALRQEMAVVPQYIHLFNTTIRENLLVACPSASQEALEQAAQQAQAHDFIQSLPQGYDTWIGEQGLRLSGGERQRIAIARALLKEAPLLILDEPLAHLDAQTARAVLKALLNGSSLAGSSRRRALLMITHRLVNLEAMDEILVMSRGRIVERGKHAELLQKDGYYRRMWDLQRVR